MTSVLGIGAKRQAALEQWIGRYAKPYRKRLRKMAKTSPRLGDLIATFPAGAFALVSNQGPVAARAEAVRLVKEGARLELAAEALGLPSWMRRLPPEAFEQPFDPIKTDADFDRQIANQAAQPAAAAAMWLEWLLAARRYGGDPFALWLARQDVYGGARLPVEAVVPLAAYAWHSGEPAAAARKQMGKFWHARMGFRSAAGEALAWLKRVIAERCARQIEFNGGWWKTQSVNGYKFAPRDTQSLLEAEGRAMKNCVASYWDNVRQGECLIYGLRRGGSAVATMEVRAVRGEPGRAVIVQLLGPGNCSVPPAVWRAARAWLQRRGACPLRSGGLFDTQAIDPTRWIAAWEDYSRAAPAAELFAGAPTHASLNALEQGYRALRRVAKF